ncbi:hypothetical protein JFN93_05870 [Geomonas sp. Red875]|uniref:Uncharacterized protein n=2 Tax=Geomesophilobacter sediminis TaxID=2798584 RepID=A0A8J7LUW5_9BACT|nr:hypothetical protein [Geomesophilobacter sediminis]
MAGNAICGEYLKARAERRTNSFELWLSGYLTGLATYDKRVNRPEKMTAALGNTGTLLLDSYCKIHPLATFQEAAREMARTVCYGDARRKN